jgi:hypothetical protein
MPRLTLSLLTRLYRALERHAEYDLADEILRLDKRVSYHGEEHSQPDRRP